MLFRRALLVFSVLTVIGFPVKADELTQEKRADIERLLVMTNAFSVGKQMSAAVVGILTQNLKKNRPDISQNVLDLLPAEVAATFDENIGSLKEDLIPIYHKHFTGPEIKEIILFYSTELGQKTIQVMPSLMQEGMIVGQKWGESLGPKINQRVTARLRKQGVKI